MIILEYPFFSIEECEEIKVKLIEIDKKTGKFRLSRKVLIPKPEK